MHRFARLALPLLVSLAPACAEGARGAVPGAAPPVLPPTLPRAAPLPGLVAAAAGSGELCVHYLPGGLGTECALLRALSPGTVATSPPLALDPNEDRVRIGGLTDGLTQFVGLGVRQGSSGPYTLTGPVLVVRPAPPIYVDAGADPMVADGTSPATAFASLTRAYLTAFLRGGGNLWVRDGAYETANLPQFGGVHAFGGFDASFALDRRDPTGERTRWGAAGAAVMVGIQPGAGPAVLDGVVLAGGGVGTVGIDVSQTDTQLRCVRVERFTDRGIRARAAGSTPARFSMVGSSSVENGADGLSLLGPFEVELDGSSFVGNAQEGVECGPLEAPEGGRASLLVRGCTLSGNASEGLDADLAAPPLAGTVPGAPGGTFDLLIVGSRFERNGLDGLLVDVDYEGVAGFGGSLEILGCQARANRAAGIHVDADAPLDVFVHRALVSANGGDGLLVSSESDAGLVVVSASVAAGNLGAGIRHTFGNRTIAASHCVLAGNAGGGLVSDTLEAAGTSCVLWLQPAPPAGSPGRLRASPDVGDPATPVFANAPEAYLRATALSGDRLVLSPSAAPIPSGGVLELEDDGRAAPFTFLDASSVRLRTPPPALSVPASVTAFAPGSGPQEDYRVRAGSAAEGAGLAPPGAAPVDAGPFGGGAPGEPGRYEPRSTSLLRVAGVVPGPAASVAGGAPIEVRFSEDLAPGSVGLDQVRAVTVGGTPIDVVSDVSGDRLVVTPLAGDWGAEAFELELHGGLATPDGRRHAAPLVLPYANP